MRIAYRIYVLLCVGIGLYLQHGKPHADYLSGVLYGLVGSWFGPGLLLELLLGHTHDDMAAVLGGSFAFWLVAGLLRKAYRTKAKGKPSRAGLAVAESPYAESPYIALPNLPPEYGYYPKPGTHTTRTVRYIEER